MSQNLNLCLIPPLLFPHLLICFSHLLSYSLIKYKAIISPHMEIFTLLLTCCDKYSSHFSSSYCIVWMSVLPNGCWLEEWDLLLRPFGNRCSLPDFLFCCSCVVFHLFLSIWLDVYLNSSCSFSECVYL